MTVSSRHPNRDEWERSIIRELNTKNYKDVAHMFNTSRGTVYAIASKYGARKNEERIAEKQREKKSRRQEFFNDVLNATVKSDVLDYLDGLPNESVDLWITSPPYGIGKSYESSLGQFGLSYYIGWLLQVTAEMARVLKHNGTMCLQLGSTKLPDGQPYPIDAILTEHLRSMGLHFKTRIVWTSSHGLTPKRRLAERYEVILVFTRSADYVFNANAARIPQKQPDKRAYKGPKKGQLSGHPLGAHPTNVWDIGTVKNGSPDRKACGDHPAPFPVKLVKRLIMLYSMPGDVIGDPFCGSGSSCVGAIETGRSYTGADILYEDMRNERLSRVAPDLVSELTGVTDKSVAVWNAEARPITLDAIDKNAFMSENSIADLFGDAI